MNAMGINEQSLAGDVNPIADHVASVGRNKMRLLPGAPMMSARKVEALTGDTAGVALKGYAMISSARDHGGYKVDTSLY